MTVTSIQPCEGSDEIMETINVGSGDKLEAGVSDDNNDVLDRRADTSYTVDSQEWPVCFLPIRCRTNFC